jgi:hypothetical protein
MNQKELQEIFDYKDGKLIWKVDRSDKVKKGKVAGCLRINGYTSIHFNKKTYLAHRLIFIYHYNYIPKFIDHINNNRSDNRIENLRECSMKQNMFNRVKYGNHKYKGVYKIGNKYKVQIMDNGNLKYLGLFNNEDEAALIYNNYAQKLFGEFAYLNKIV